jgi:hypothetical protein
MWAGTRGFITTNQSGGTKLNKMDAGYPNGSVGLSSWLFNTWYFFADL